MKTRIQRYGNSTVIRLDRKFMDYNNLKVGDWIEMPDLNDCNPTAEQIVNDLNKGGKK